MPLIIVPTPVGNLEDMTLRGLRVLREADVIACEDTRHTLQLLNHFEIKRPLVSCHEHNETARAHELAKLVREGKNIALVSDAGTPGLSDPGGAVVKYMLDSNLPVDVLPGANALLPALLLSGIGMESFTFVGFLRGKKCEKQKQLEAVKNLEHTLVFYIAPHSLTKDLAQLAEILGDRRAALVREISKIHQETITATLETFSDVLPEEKIRGEFVCVVEGAKKSEPDEKIWAQEAKKLIEAGETAKTVAGEISKKYNIPLNTVKRKIIKL